MRIQKCFPQKLLWRQHLILEIGKTFRILYKYLEKKNWLEYFLFKYKKSDQIIIPKQNIFLLFIFTTMHPEILSESQKEILPIFKNFSDQFGLVGGTAIALHLGHRKSIDFDFFGTTSFDNERILSSLRKSYSIESIMRNDREELTFLIQGVQVTFLCYPYPLSFPIHFENILRLPDIETLSAMKLFALGRRAKWKDYVDIFFILRNGYMLSHIFERAQEIFGNEMNEKLLREELCYFSDIDYSESVSYLPGFETSDQEIKTFLQKISIS
ncbi:MAG: hypothetical protein EOM19_05980 [Candidatus Moranbacteria bacterium]|nr:hypothetical protein [Candidatus Moranbacteria bacterium]